MSYPYDPQTREYVARLLYERLPAMLRVQDELPKGHEELRRFLAVLAAPLAALRQNVEELHADLFIDTANDWVLPYLADMVGTTLIFPDADRNRRDVRETVGWRKRKGTPSMLQEMGSLLAERLVVTREGWKLVQMTQDLDLVRRGRRLPDLTDARIAETVSGPLVAAPHTVDVRAISERTGKFHPRHVFHWLHPTLCFPLGGGTPADLTEAADPDLRFAFHPLGELLPLRARRTDERDPLPTDRVPPLHFAAAPGEWFGRDGRFTISICGHPAGVAAPSAEPRGESLVPAAMDLLAGNVALNVLEHPRRRFYGALRVQVVGAPFAGPPPGLPDTTLANVDIRAEVVLDAQAPPPSAVVNNGPVDPTDVVMIRIEPVGAGARFFPGATLEIASDEPGAALAAADTELAADGFLRGALFVTLPPMHVTAERWLYLAGDGSVVDAQSAGNGAVDVQVLAAGPARRLDGDRLALAGPGAAWPPLRDTRDPEPWPHFVPAPGRGPAVLHGGRALQDSGGGAFQDVPAGTDCSLVLAVRHLAGGGSLYRPIVRLLWQGPDPAGAEWAALDDDGLTIAAGADARFAFLAQWRDGELANEAPPFDPRLVVRFECELDDAVLAPAEVSLLSADGRAVLAHLPQLAAQNGSPIPAWPTDAAAFPGVSPAVYVGVDGSTWSETTSDPGRSAWGDVAPLREYTALRRRRIAWRSLCQWENENPPILMHAATEPGRLDVDPGHGLFALALAEPPQALPEGPDGPPPPPLPPSITVDFEQGYSDEIGALPAPREPLLDRRLAAPTRVVSRSGRLRQNASAALHALPRYRTLGDALLDVAAAPLPEEVIEIQDSATYPAEDLTWPAGVDRLTVQAAENERPWIEIAAWAEAPGAAYDSLALLGIAFGAGALADLPFPPAAEASVELATVTRAGNRLLFAAHPQGPRVLIHRCLTAGLALAGPGTLTIRDSVVDTGLGQGLLAIETQEARVEMDRVTVFGRTEVRELEASEVYFEDDVTVEDRFTGCVRYSRVTAASVLPRIHRVVVDVAAGFVAADRNNPAHGRLTAATDPRILQGAEDGGEIGAFHGVRLVPVARALLQRLVESTPAGLATGVLRAD